MNGIRRHLTPSQKAAIAVEMLPLLEEEAAKRQATAGREQAARGKEGGRGKQKPLTQKVEQGVSERNEQSAAAVAAATTGTNRQYVADAKKLKEEDPEEFERLKTGETTLPQAQRKQREQKKETRRAENHRKVADVPPADIVTAGARFATIMIDPPWDWGDEGDADQLGRARPAYATMPIDQLHALPVAKLADDDCHLYLWITNRSLPKGFALLEGWGFRYITMLTWVKPYFGMGNYFRGQTEQILFGVKGNQQLLRKDAGTVFYADRGKGHSAKPKEFYPFVESCSPGPFLEMFSRSERLGWSAWGEASGSASAQF
jgi:N6-adenosine-specific RNA methylase IME4